jgi:hypothetical protein
MVLLLNDDIPFSHTVEVDKHTQCFGGKEIHQKWAFPIQNSQNGANVVVSDAFWNLCAQPKMIATLSQHRQWLGEPKNTTLKR